MRVLCIDGGGIRGLIPAVVLAEIERRTGRRIATMVDLVAGTSTGGILACGLTRRGPDGGPRYAAAELAALYEQEGPRIFHRSLRRRISSVEGLIDERYDADGLEAALARYLGEERLSGALSDVLLTAYDIERREAVFLRSAGGRADRAEDFALVDAARATAAAPTYFEPARIRDLADAATYALVDGSVFATNPSLCAYADVAAAGRAGELELMLSLGTGSMTRRYPWEQVRGWGSLEWARPLLAMVFDGVADTIEFQAATLMGERYVRLQTELQTASDDLDDASPVNLARLRAEADELIAANDAAIERACAVLAG